MAGLRQTEPAEEPAGRPTQPTLVTDFTPLQGSRKQCLKQVMDLGDRVRSNRQGAWCSR